jgi:hypothetical protein
MIRTEQPVAKKAEPQPVAPPPGPGKGRATPTRREAEQARRQPLVPTDRRAAQKVSRAKLAEERARARAGLAAGDERYFLPRDRGPQRRFARDAVDSRFTLGELAFPLLAVLLLVTFVVPPQTGLVLFPVVYGIGALMLLDGWLRARRIRKQLAAKLGGDDRIERGLTLYVISRSIQMRPLRSPKPRVKRGERPS